MPSGSFVTHFGKQVHWDGAKDEEAWVLEMSLISQEDLLQ
jgi:hypothetical protein